VSHANTSATGRSTTASAWSADVIAVRGATLEYPTILAGTHGAAALLRGSTEGVSGNEVRLPPRRRVGVGPRDVARSLLIRAMHLRSNPTRGAPDERTPR
jgi:hypothetical protein